MHELRHRHGRSRNDAQPEADRMTLERMGHKEELKRNFSMISMLGLAFAILNSWTALAASINLALPSGGPSAVIWGLMVAGVCNLALAASLAEFLSAYPTAGGQYHWAAIISWKSVSRGVSYVTGWINVSGWVALSAAGGLLASAFIMNVMLLLHPEYEAKPWHQFLLYIGITLIALVINMFLNRILPYLTKVAFFWSIAGFIVISVTVLATASPNYQSASWVYGDFINSTGWPDGLAWLFGLLQGAFALTGFDATAHMIEEIPEPHIQGPKIMIYCIVIGMFTGFVFLSCILFCVSNVDQVIGGPRGPLLEVLMQATGNAAGSTCLMMFPLICVIFATVGIMCTSSRMTWAFARDKGMPFSQVFAKVDSKLDLPLNALYWTTAWVIAFGLIFIGSTAAFNAITSASVVALGITYAIPPTINCLRLRRALPEDRAFKLKGAAGWVLNLVGIFWTILTTVLFIFPPATPVSSSSMNYCIVAFGVMFLIAGGTWVLGGPHRRINIMEQPVGEQVSVKPAQLPTGIELPGEYTGLRKLQASHAPSLFKHLGGEENFWRWTYMMTSGFATAQDCSESIETWAAKSDPFYYAVYDRPLSDPIAEPVGLLAFLAIFPDHRRIEIGSVILGGTLVKTRQATEAFYLFIQHAIEDLGYHRVEWKANHLNAPSLAAARRLGFTFEGIFRKHMIIKGRRRDTAWFSITDDEWPAIKAGFVAWLDQDNFDESGKQKRSLQTCRES